MNLSRRSRHCRKIVLDKGMKFERLAAARKEHAGGGSPDDRIICGEGTGAGREGRQRGS